MSQPKNMIFEHEIITSEHKEPEPVKTELPADSPLNTWFRQQGASNTTVMPQLLQVKSEKMKRSENSFHKLPNIVTNNNSNNDLNLKKRHFLTTISDNSFSSIPNLNDPYAAIRIQTPKLSSFYLKY